MIVATCEHKNRKKNGVTKAGTIRYRCKDCGKSWTESTSSLGGMRVPMDKAAKIVEMLCEGVSVRATCRMLGVSKGTVLELLLYVGQQCEHYMAENIKDVFVGECQIDEIWGWVFCKAKTAKEKKYVGGCGDCYCYTAIDRETKLLVTWHMGRRNEQHNRKHSDLFARNQHEYAPISLR